MALSKTKFKASAVKLFAKAKAGGLTTSCTFELLGEYDPVLETNATSVTDTVDCIREDYTDAQKDGTIIQRSDFKLLAQFDSFTKLSPRTDGVVVTVDGVRCTIVNGMLDAADAVYTLQVRGG